MRKLFFLILLYPTILLFPQTKNIVIQWDRQDARHFFPHALYEDGENTLPYLSRKIAWPSQGMLPVVSLEVNPDNVLTGAGVGFFAQGDYEKLREQVSILIQNDNLRNEIGDRAQEYALANHSEKNIQRLMEVF